MLVEWLHIQVSLFYYLCSFLPLPFFSLHSPLSLSFSRSSISSLFPSPLRLQLISISLVSSINFERPNLVPVSFSLSSPPITSNPPEKFFSGNTILYVCYFNLLFNFNFSDTIIPDVGELMLASFPYDFKSSVEGNIWYMTEAMRER